MKKWMTAISSTRLIHESLQHENYYHLYYHHWPVITTISTSNLFRAFPPHSSRSVTLTVNLFLLLQSVEHYPNHISRNVGSGALKIDHSKAIPQALDSVDHHRSLCSARDC